MSYIAIVTEKFDELVNFYGVSLSCPTVDSWDRENGRGARFDLGGNLRLEILDNLKQREPLVIGEAREKFHIVIEIEDIDAARERLLIESPPPQSTSWGARIFKINDPDGTPVTFLQWLKTSDLGSLKSIG